MNNRTEQVLAHTIVVGDTLMVPVNSCGGCTAMVVSAPWRSGGFSMGEYIDYIVGRDELVTKVRDRVWFTVGDIAAHDGSVFSVIGDDWTYQELCGSHGTVLYEGPSEAEARRILAEWLQCDSVDKGTYCYTHNRVRS